ncbi:Bcl2-associated agonist of cell death [Triplophysa tibetana]|uniref:Bcl2-associated agonist of cell death n=1 Tax=Triplophysa tibetana TaxID=1572043 RepID=A0A5A9PQD1_9TELE|nr:Bcl2-associated agonist of cell death [Triplophysa tibetana]
MAQMFTVSDSESSDDQEDSLQTHKESPKRKQHFNVSARQKREQLARQRNRSMNEEDLLEIGTGEEGESFGGEAFRRRTHSAPPALWAAKKYGRQLRRMSDEFDNLHDKGMKKVRSAGAERQMHPSPSWLSFLWSHKESDAESRPGE